MASKQQVIAAYNEVCTKYARTLSMLVDALDQLDKKPTEIEVEKIVEVEADIDLDLSLSLEVTELENRLATRMQNEAQ